LWFAPHGKTPPQSAALTVFDAGALRAQRDGSRNFKVDVMYGDDAARTFIVKFQLHMDGEKLELVRAENPARAQLFPSQNPVSLVQTAYADYQSAVGPAPDDGDETTGTLIYPGWGELTPRGIFPSATRTAPVRLLTLNLKWKPGAVGSAKLNFTADTREISGIDAYDALSLTVQGPPAEETD
ncbi:MAG: hypothetical protein MPJ22_10180, partial [Pirellulales bacterium]|nr:hypothetical protein [Alphaproteobacteria bacterium]MDA8042770.1 hypothetical protein [Pirellulales bacterium]